MAELNHMRMLPVFFRLVFLGLASLVWLVGGPSEAWARRPIQKIKVQGELRSELNAVLRAAVELQESSYRRNERQTAAAIRALIQRLDGAAKKSGLAREQKLHLLKIVNSARAFLDKSRRTAGANRHTFFQGAFKQLVQIAQVFQLDPYKIYFCPKDKSVWLQRAARPQNPVNPETYGDCGKLVP